MKIGIVYLTMTGNTGRMAEEIAEGIRGEGVEARLFSIREEVDYDYLKECSCVIFGTPAINGSLGGEMKLWLDRESRKCGLYGKLGGVFATAKFVHGGADIAMQAMLMAMLCSGMMAFSTGNGEGGKGLNPIHSGPVAIDSELDKYIPLFRMYGKRMANQAKKLYS